jgi:hypothetical protein
MLRPKLFRDVRQGVQDGQKQWVCGIWNTRGDGIDAISIRVDEDFNIRTYQLKLVARLMSSAYSRSDS